jgi:hypothetical protein
MLLLRIAAAPARISPVFHTDEIPQAIALDSDDKPFALSWLAPPFVALTYPLPLSTTDELFIAPVTIVDDDSGWLQVPWAAFAFKQPLTDTDEVFTIPVTVVDDDLGWAQIPWAAFVFRQPAIDTDEVSVAKILEDEPPWVQGKWQVSYYAQPATDTDEFHFTAPPVVEEDTGWTPISWQANYFRQPATDTDEIGRPKVIEDEPPWVQIPWVNLLWRQPATDTDELFSSLVISVPNVLGVSVLNAQAVLSAAGFVPVVGANIYSSLYGLGLIAGESPAGGTFALPGSIVIINMSLGAGPPARAGYAMVPNVLGMFYYDAQLAILEAGFRIAPPNFVAPVASPTVPFPQYVVAQSIPGGAFIAVQTQITITVPGFTTLLVTNTPDAHL